MKSFSDRTSISSVGQKYWSAFGWLSPGTRPSRVTEEPDTLAKALLFRAAPAAEVFTSHSPAVDDFTDD